MVAGNAPVGAFSGAGRAVAAAVLLGLCLRLGFAFVYWVDKPLMKDEQEYLLLATRLATGQGVTYPTETPTGGFFERPPGFVVFLASVLTLTQDPLVTTDAPRTVADLPKTSSEIPAAITIAQGLLGTFVILLIAALAGRVGGKRAAGLAAFGAAVYPPMAWVSGFVLSEPLYSILALSTVWLLHQADDRSGSQRLGWTLAAGVVGGAGLLTKEAIVFFFPLVAAWMLVRKKRMDLVLFALGVSLVVAPWIARNYVVHGKLILTAAHGGVTLWTGNNPLARGEGDLAANPIMGEARRAIEAQHQGLSNQAMDDLYYRAAVDFVLQHPGSWIVLEFKKLFYTFVPIGPSYTLHSTLHYAATVIPYALLAPPALIGLVRLLRRKGPSPIAALGLLAVSSVVMCLVFFPQERFRIPVMDPCAIVAAAVALSSRRR